MVSTEKLRKIANELNIDLRKLSLSTLRKGVKVELEHGKKSPKTNVTSDNLKTTVKIVLAHVMEYKDYYERLEDMEKQAKKYWGNTKFNPYKTT
jgi:hypothetical protein